MKIYSKLIPTYFLFTFFIVHLDAQEKSYRAFAVEGGYGITDAAQKEIVMPVYPDFKVNQIGNFYLLKNERGSILFRYTDGIKLEFDRLNSKTVSTKTGVFYYGDRHDKTFLINEYDLKETKLPARYTKINGLGYIVFGEQASTPKMYDLIHIDRPFEVAASIEVDLIYHFSRTGDNNTAGEIYIITSGDKTFIYDDQLELLYTFQPKLKDKSDLKKIVYDTLNIKLDDPKEPLGMLYGMLPYNELKHEYKNGRTSFFTIYDKNKNVWFDIAGPAKLTQRESCIEIFKENTETIDTYFCADSKSKTIFLPQKYYKNIDLKLVDNKK